MANQLRQMDVHGRALYRYITALEEGNVDTLLAFYHQAERDEALARMIEEVNVLYQTEEDWATSQEDAQLLRPLLARLSQSETQGISSSSIALQSSRQEKGSMAPGEEGQEQPTVPVSQNIVPGTFLKRLQEIGLKSDFVFQRLLPAPLAHRLQASQTPGEARGAVLEAAAIIERIFKFTPAMLFGSDSLIIDKAALGATRFKKDPRQKTERISAYTVYAHYLATLVLKATEHIPQKSVPTQSEVVRKAILSSYGELSFATALQYVWNLGIPVLPLSDIGAFHGACWRINHRNVIVIKQRTRSDARWLFDLLHELRHAGQDPEQAQFEIIETDQVPLAEQVTTEEKIASTFAGNVILRERAEELTQMCVDAARGRIESLKRVVPLIAKCEHVAVDALANYLAFRLSLQNVDWWPAATTLQTPANTALPTARELILQQANLNTLDEDERQLLRQALQ